MVNPFNEASYWVVAGWTMLHFLWVGGLIGLLAGAGRLALGSTRPIIRYTYALTCLAALTVAPVAIAAVLMTERSTPSGEPLVMPLDLSESDEAASTQVIPPDRAVVPLQRSFSGAVLIAQLTARMDKAAGYLPWAWLIGAPLVFMLAATGLAGAERLRHQSRLLHSGEVEDICHRLRVSLRMAHSVAIGVCDQVASPVLIGVLRPVILLPPAALMGWNADQLEMVLIHELAHVRRWDNLINLLQRVVESVLFFHPVVWMVSRWVRCEREHCCDEVVLTYTRQPRAYAQMLAAMVVPARVNLAVVAMGEANVVSRIRQVLRLQDDAMKLSHKVMGLLMSGFIAAAIVFGASSRPLAAARPELATPLAIDSASPAVAPPASSMPPPVAVEQPAPSTPEAEPAPSSAEQRQLTPWWLADRPATAKLPAVVAAAIAPVETQDAVTLLLVDPEGRPVEGANQALRVRWEDEQVKFFFRRSEAQNLTSAADGSVLMPWVWFRNSPSPACTPVIAMHTGRQLAGTLLVPSDSRARTLTLSLQPLCRVRFRVDSPDLHALEYPLIQVKNLDGHPISLADYRGKPLIVYFPAAQVACELNKLVGFCKQYEQQGLTMLVIHSPTDTVSSDRFAPECLREAVDGPGWTEVAGPIRGNPGATASNYGLDMAHALFLIDA